MPDYENCVKGREPLFACQLNYEAVNLWRFLDIYGRDIDTFSGVPRTLRTEAVEIECNKHSDPDGLKWRVFLIEDKIFAKRIKEYNAKAEQRNKGKK